MLLFVVFIKLIKVEIPYISVFVHRRVNTVRIATFNIGRGGREVGTFKRGAVESTVGVVSGTARPRYLLARLSRIVGRINSVVEAFYKNGYRFSCTHEERFSGNKAAYLQEPLFPVPNTRSAVGRGYFGVDAFHCWSKKRRQKW